MIQKIFEKHLRKLTQKKNSFNKNIAQNTIYMNHTVTVRENVILIFFFFVNKKKYEKNTDNITCNNEWIVRNTQYNITVNSFGKI